MGLTYKVIPYIIVILVLKYLSHEWSWEFLTLSPLFTAIISANIFLVGFLISGVLTDYKESEKLPGELAASIETIIDECSIVYKNKKSKVGLDFIRYIEKFNDSLLDWFFKKEKISDLMNKLAGFNDFLFKFEAVSIPPFIARLKQEQYSIRKNIIRIHTIRETSFNVSAYTIVEMITVILIFGLVFVKIEPFYESIFFIAFVAFILIYMIFLIRDLDNPFGYYEKTDHSDEVSLKPLTDLRYRFKQF